MRRPFVVVVVASAFVGCNAIEDALLPNQGDCPASSAQALGSPNDLRPRRDADGDGGAAEGLSVSPIAACDPSKRDKSDVITLRSVRGQRSLVSGRGCLRCADGHFVDAVAAASEHLPPKRDAVCADPARTVTGACAVLDAAFLRAVEEVVRRDDPSAYSYESYGVESACVVNPFRTPYVTTFDWKRADRAIDAALSVMQAWEIQGPVEVQVQGIPVACADGT